MSDDGTGSLEERVQDLQAELADRERDLAVFREELAKANSQLERFIKQIAGELKLAAMIQKALVPTEFPNIPGFEFSTKFAPSPISGGDYFDIFEHEDKFRFGVVMATSSGYGMSSLFLSVLLKMSGQLEARRGVAPEQMLELMARELVPNMQNEDRASVFYAVVDRRSFDLRYSAAGQATAILLSYGSNKAQRLVQQSVPLDASFKGGLTSQTIALNPRDRVVICSEGVLRAKNALGEMFGEERLYKAILGAPGPGVHELRNEIFYQVEKFADGVDLPQDLTAIAIEVKDRVIKLAKMPSSTDP